MASMYHPKPGRSAQIAAPGAAAKTLPRMALSDLTKQRIVALALWLLVGGGAVLAVWLSR